MPPTGTMNAVILTANAPTQFGEIREHFQVKNCILLLNIVTSGGSIPYGTMLLASRSPAKSRTLA